MNKRALRLLVKAFKKVTKGTPNEEKATKYEQVLNSLEGAKNAQDLKSAASLLAEIERTE